MQMKSHYPVPSRGVGTYKSKRAIIKKTAKPSFFVALKVATILFFEQMGHAFGTVVAFYPICTFERADTIVLKLAVFTTGEIRHFFAPPVVSLPKRRNLMPVNHVKSLKHGIGKIWLSYSLVIRTTFRRPNEKMESYFPGGVIMTTDLQRQLVTFYQAFVSKLSMTESAATTPKEKDLFDLVEEARQEWQVAMSHFNQVVDPDLVDHAIHAMEAAERKYTYLLKQASREGYRLPATLDALRERRALRAKL